MIEEASVERGDLSPVGEGLDDIKQKARHLGATEDEIALASREVPQHEYLEPIEDTPEEGLTEEEIQYAPEDNELLTTEISQSDLIESTLGTSPRGHQETFLKDQSDETTLIADTDTTTETDPALFNQMLEKLRNSYSVEETIQANVNKYAQDLTAQFEQSLNQAEMENPENYEEYDEMRQTLPNLVGAYQGVAGKQQALIDKYADENLDERVLRELHAKNTIYDLYKRKTADGGVFKTAGEWASLILLPMSMTVDAGDMAPDGLVETTGDNWAALQQMIAGYQAADPEIKLQVQEQLIDKAYEAYDGSEVRMGIFLHWLHSPDFKTQTTMEESLDALAFGSLGTLKPLSWPATIKKMMSSSLSLPNKLAAMGNLKKAAEMSRKTKNPDSRALDADPNTWNATSLGDAQTPNIASQYQHELIRIEKEMKQAVDNVIMPTSEKKLDIPTDPAKHAKSYAESMVSNPDMGVRQATVVSSGPEGFKVNYLLDNEDGALLMQKTVTWKETLGGSILGEAEKIPQSLATKFGNFTLSKDLMLKTLNPKLVPEVTFAHQQVSALNKSLTDIYKSSFKKLSRREADEVEELLKVGDEWVEGGARTGKVFTDNELASGLIETSHGVKEFSPNQISAYRQARKFWDESRNLADHNLRTQLAASGIKELRYTNPVTGAVEKTMGKHYPNGQGFTNQMDEVIYTPGLGASNFSVRNSVDLAEARKAGYHPVAFNTAVIIDGQKITHALLPNTSVSAVAELPSRILNPRTGYVADTSNPGYIYIKDALDHNKTIARAETMEEANEFIALVNQQQKVNKNPNLKQSSLKAYHDRDYTAMESVLEASETFGGLIYGSRSTTPIKNLGRLNKGNVRQPVTQSTARYIDSISFEYPLNEYRIARVQSWKDTVVDGLKRSNVKSDDPIMRAVKHPSEWKKVDLNAIDDETLKAHLIAERDWMIDNLRIPSQDERIWKNTVMKVADMMPNGKARGLAVQAAHENPLASLKGATFDAYLGWLNPKHLYIQLQNSAIAIAQHPIHGLAASLDAIVQRSFLYTDKIDKNMFREAAKGVLPKKYVEDSIEALEQFKRSGLEQDIMNTADFSSNLAGFSNGTLELYKKAATHGRALFRNTAAFARMISFNVARKQWKMKNPGKVIDDAAIKDISKDTLRMEMNLQKANAAGYQNNPLTSIPSQFMQPFAKFGENVVGGLLGNGRWTRKETLATLAGMTAMYGIEGVPGVDAMGEYFKEQVSGSASQFDINNPKTGRIINEGITGAVSMALGLENNFSSEGNLMAGFEDTFAVEFALNIGKILFGSERELQIDAPAIGVIHRSTDAFINTFDNVKNLLVAPSLENLKDATFGSLDSFFSITSTWSNTRKIWFAKELGGITDARHRIIISNANLENSGVNIQSLIMKGMGIKLNAEKAFWEQNLINMDRKDLENETRKDIKKLQANYFITGNREKYMSNLAWLLEPFDPTTRSELLVGAITSAADQRSELDKMARKMQVQQIKTGFVGPQGSHQSILLDATTPNKEVEE